MAVSRRLRYEILRRDDHTCRYCGGKAPDVKLTVDHVVPIALGGADAAANLVTACATCNAGKSSSSPDQPIVENVADDALRWAKAMERAAEIEAAKTKKVDPVLKAVDEVWTSFNVGDKGDDVPRPAGWQATIREMVGSGLIADDFKDAIQIAMGAKHVYNDKVWRYFCGVCWNKLRQRQDVAAALLEAEGE